MSSSKEPLEDVVAEARRIVTMAGHQTLTVRVLGGAGVALHDHVDVPDSLVRTYGDIDVVVPAKAARATTSALTALGYTPNERFNALHGARRMLFYDTVNGRQLDVFVGVFSMCHELDLTKRLGRHPQALSAADLLLTKLQIAEINRKDVVDAVRILLSHDIDETGSDEPAAESGPADLLSLRRLQSVTSTDWGWYTTLTDNLGSVRAATPELLTGDDERTVLSRVDRVRSGLEDAPKSMRWRARSFIGRKTPWYELPEEVDRGGVQ
jgi:Uncharacterised nucleotidyltransferase